MAVYAGCSKACPEPKTHLRTSCRAVVGGGTQGSIRVFSSVLVELTVSCMPCILRAACLHVLTLRLCPCCKATLILHVVCSPWIMSGRSRGITAAEVKIHLLVTSRISGSLETTAKHVRTNRQDPTVDNMYICNCACVCQHAHTLLTISMTSYIF